MTKGFENRNQRIVSINPTSFLKQSMLGGYEGSKNDAATERRNKLLELSKKRQEEELVENNMNAAANAE